MRRILSPPSLPPFYSGCLRADRSRKTLLAAALLLPMTLLLATSLSASPEPKAVLLQQSGPEKRSEFTFTVKVDSIYGDDVEAVKHNPTKLGGNPTYPHRGKPLMYHTNTNEIGGVLTTAPYSFRTISAALTYVSQFNPGAATGWPWVNTKSQKKIIAFVIQLMPGLYGPILNPDSKGREIDPKSGLPWNGESFPLHIPDWVSIQGTSALNTIIDVRGNEANGPRTYAFGFSSNLNNLNSHLYSFLDGLTIRNARTEMTCLAPAGAAVYVDCTDGNCRPTISNCFIVMNDVGIAVDGAPDEDIQGPVIVNDTLAWNGIGIWNGELNATGQSYGYVLLAIWNTLFDATPPPAGTGIATTTAFEGVHNQDMEIVTADGPLNFNAWECGSGPWGYANLGLVAPLPPGWVVTLPRTSPVPPTPLQPRVDIVNYTQGGTPNSRGTLYVNDLFRNAQSKDRSPHDFRLSPKVSSAASTPPSILNPLVNAGYVHPVHNFSNGSVVGVQFANGITVNVVGLRGPGSHSLGYHSEFAQFDASDWDCDGFGNPRQENRSGFSQGSYSNYDIGADELGELLMAGYIDSTRIFSRMVPQAGLIADHTEVFFVNFPGATFPRPIFNASLSEGFVEVDYNWFDQAQVNPNAPNGLPNSNYTDGVSPIAAVMSKRWFLQLTNAKPPHMRNLRCDITPHLHYDLSPLWGEWFYIYRQGKKGLIDPYSAHPWYRDKLKLAPAAATNDNFHLYYNPAGAGKYGPSACISGHPSPPGTWWYLATIPQRDWLWSGWTTAQFGPYNGGGLSTYATDAWGLGDFGGTDRVLTQPSWQGVRYNCEVLLTSPAVTYSNLQSFLGVNGLSAPLSQMTAEERSKLPKGTLPKANLVDLVKNPMVRTGR